jgi:hypothetical protein
VVERDGIRMTFRMEHRPLEAYGLALEAAGLAIEAIREPRPDPWLLGQSPERAEMGTHPPLPAPAGRQAVVG